MAGPEVVSRGFVYAQNAPELIELTRQRAEGILREYSSNGSLDVPGLSRQLRNNLSSFLFKQTGMRPMVLPVVLETAAD